MKNTYYSVFLVIEIAISVLVVDKSFGFNLLGASLLLLKAIGLVSLYKHIEANNISS